MTTRKTRQLPPEERSQLIQKLNTRINELTQLVQSPGWGWFKKILDHAHIRAALIAKNPNANEKATYMALGELDLISRLIDLPETKAVEYAERVNDLTMAARATEE